MFRFLAWFELVQSHVTWSHVRKTHGRKQLKLKMCMAGEIHAHFQIFNISKGGVSFTGNKIKPTEEHNVISTFNLILIKFSPWVVLKRRFIINMGLENQSIQCVFSVSQFYLTNHCVRRACFNWKASRTRHRKWILNVTYIGFSNDHGLSQTLLP